ncbi:MAG: hypothetical protein IK064_05825, partial [Clostridia bacterium]|nr:hypothetical protein [Clostridia bacterium]
TYEVSELDRFSCENGRWYRERLTRTSKQRMQLGNLMRNTDALSRKRYSMNAQLKTEGLTAELEAVILKEIDAFLTEKRIAEMPKVEFDLSKLEKIRSSADETAGMLLAVSDEAAAETDGGDERDPEIGAEREAPSPCAEEEIESGDTADDPAVSSLNKGERALLECLVRRQDYGPALRSLGMLPSVAADGINEKLMERFGDIVIIDNGAEYEIIDDYLDELKGLLGIK